MTAHPCRVEVKAEDLLLALRSLNAAQRAGKSVRVSFHNGELELVRAATAVRVPAAGTWPLTAIVRVELVRDLLRRQKALPETLVVCGSDTMLHVSHYAIPCSWDTEA